MNISISISININIIISIILISILLMMIGRVRIVELAQLGIRPCDISRQLR